MPVMFLETYLKAISYFSKYSKEQKNLQDSISYVMTRVIHVQKSFHINAYVIAPFWYDFFNAKRKSKQKQQKALLVTLNETMNFL